MQLSKFTRLVGTKEAQNAAREFSSFWYKAHTQSILVSYVCLSNYSKLKVQRFFFLNSEKSVGTGRYKNQDRVISDAKWTVLM